MRPIDADAVLDRYYAEYERQDICDGAEDREWLMKCLNEAPTLTPQNEAIVHCADCANLMFSDYYGECKKCYLGGIIRPNDYCSRGIRREKTHEQT